MAAAINSAALCEYFVLNARLSGGAKYNHLIGEHGGGNSFLRARAAAA